MALATLAAALWPVPSPAWAGKARTPPALAAKARTVPALAAQRTARAAAPKIADDFPIPPIPPLTRPLPSVAPVPDADLTAPSSLASGPTVALKFYRAPTFDPGYGFAPGSRYRSPEDRKPIQTPGFSVSVPIR